ncbi:MAG: glycoside hydrolase family 130 protein [Bacteroidetes bacterium]|nr:glycoside hydrolase family 130 protein [Bacteroidota bacterium]
MKAFLVLFSFLSLVACSEVSHKKMEDPQSESWAFPLFQKVDSINPILNPTQSLSFTDPITNSKVFWEERNVLNPAAIVKNDTVYMLYRAQDQWGTSRIGLAYSTDGLHFEKRANPVFFPDQDPQKTFEWNYRKEEGVPYSLDCKSCYFDGVEDPRIVQSETGSYIMTYTAYDGRTARMSIASSKDLIHWEKHGLILKDDKYKNYWSKSGSIVTQRIGNQQVVVKIKGKYWMYFGDTNLFMATSEDLIHWTPLEDAEKGTPVSVLNPRSGYFDSRLVEPGPYALYDENKGILLIYNASNAANFNDPELPKFTYAAGQALFNAEAPYKLEKRTRSYFIYPDKEYEKVGEVNEVCFVEGLVYFNNQWFLYYGTADSKIAVAVFDPALSN